MTKDAKKRKETPIFSGVLDYFPDAIRAVAEVSWVGNEQHNPGSKLHWDRSKSGDELDALSRHLMDAGSLDSDGMRHSAKVAWRALANLQKEIEREKQDQEEEDLIEFCRKWDEFDEMYPEITHSQFPNKDGLHPREAKENKKIEYRKASGDIIITEGFTPEFKQKWSEDRMNIIGQNGNDGLHYETTLSAYPESNISYEIQTPEGKENSK